MLALRGCASIIRGTDQTIQITTPPTTEANCTLSNPEGNWTVVSPGSVTVQRSKGDIQIRCTKPGWQDGVAAIPSNFEGWTAGNLVAGGPIGFGIMPPLARSINIPKPSKCRWLKRIDQRRLPQFNRARRYRRREVARPACKSGPICARIPAQALWLRIRNAIRELDARRAERFISSDHPDTPSERHRDIASSPWQCRAALRPGPFDPSSPSWRGSFPQCPFP
jgi:hypothetical protein